MMFRFTGYHNPLWMYPEEPELNLVRAALGALGSALGGAQAMPHPSFDEAYAIPTEKGQSLALGTQQILAEESNITKTVDPLAGSYYVEWLTNRMEEAIVGKMKEVEKEIKRAAQGIDNLMPYLIEAAKAYVSIGEITKTLKDVWGAYKEPIIV